MSGKTILCHGLGESNDNKNQKKHVWGRFCCFFILSMLLVGCNSSKKEIDEKYRSGVVLIVNEYYYTLMLPNGAVFYLAGDGEGNITNFATNSDSIANCVTAVTGTGFFISTDGKIATNKHVASRTVSDRSAVRATKQILNSLARYLENQNDTCEMLKNYCSTQYSLSTDNMERDRLVQLFNAADNQIKENNGLLRELNHLDPEDAKIEYHSTLKIAYNETFVKTEEDLYPCTLRDTSDKDIAIIQLNSKQTPPDKYVFTVPEKNMLEHYSFGEYISRLFGSDKNEELYMIGFNRGLGMAVTDEGIYSQCTEGSVNQTQKDIIQYNINTEPGSSGSPVLNRRGQLVAINFAAYKNAQNFNYGIKSIFLDELIQKQ